MSLKSFFWTQAGSDFSPFGVLNVGDKEAKFESMAYVKHGDTLRFIQQTNALTIPVLFSGQCLMTLVKVDKRKVEKDWNAEKANQNQDDFQSYCQKFPQSEKDQTFVTEVISKIKRLKMKGKRAEEKVSSGLKKSPYWQQKTELFLEAFVL